MCFHCHHHHKGDIFTFLTLLPVVWKKPQHFRTFRPVFPSPTLQNQLFLLLGVQCLNPLSTKAIFVVKMDYNVITHLIPFSSDNVNVIFP